MITIDRAKIEKNLNRQKATAYYISGKQYLGLFARRFQAVQEADGCLVIKTWTYKDSIGKHRHSDARGRSATVKAIIAHKSRLNRLRKLAKQMGKTLV